MQSWIYYCICAIFKADNRFQLVNKILRSGNIPHNYAKLQLAAVAVSDSPQPQTSANNIIV